MIFPMYFNTVKGGLDWYGFRIVSRENTLIIEEGRIGITDNPVFVSDGIAQGGYYLPETEIPYDDNDRTIDLLLDTYSQGLFIMVRTDDIQEQYDADQYRLLLSLATRQSADSPWLVATPLRSMYEDTNNNGTHDSFSEYRNK